MDERDTERPGTRRTKIGTVCIACFGSGSIDRQVARLADHELTTDVIVDHCEACGCQGWIPFADR